MAVIRYTSWAFKHTRQSNVCGHLHRCNRLASTGNYPG